MILYFTIGIRDNNITIIAVRGKKNDVSKLELRGIMDEEGIQCDRIEEVRINLSDLRDCEAEFRLKIIDNLEAFECFIKDLEQTIRKLSF